LHKGQFFGQGDLLTGRILSPMTCSVSYRGSATPVRYYPSTAPVSLDTFVVPTLIKTILERFRPAFGVLPKNGDAEPVDRGKRGWERPAPA